MGGGPFDMGYLRLRRSQVILFSFAAFSLLFIGFPEIDLEVSRLFYHGHFLRELWWQKLLYTGLGYFICISVAAAAAICLYNRWSKRTVCNCDLRRVFYLVLVLVIGAGLIVNVMLKDNFGRARPRDVTEFGGTKQFTPAFFVSHECNRNCSFSSGDAAGGFFSLALALALSRRRAVYVAGLTLGAAVSLARIAAGAHFFSDTVVSFFVMLIVADALFYFIVMRHAERRVLPVPVVLPAET
jgi:lipid A 4'-phosphatase